MHDLADIMGDRDAAICRELTKLHEEIRRAPLSELAEHADALETRGEFVLVVGPPPADARRDVGRATSTMLLRGLAEGRQRQGCGRARGRNLRPSPPRDLCPRARTRRATRGDRRTTMTETDAHARRKSRGKNRVARTRRRLPTGLSAESRAAAYLIAKGYRILARRFRTPHGEIDIVARRRGLLAFVEVKARATPRRRRLCGDAAPAAAHHRRRRRPG